MKQSQMLKASWGSVEPVLAELILDLMLVGGLCLLGYGLWLFKPWVAYAVVGTVMVIISVGAAILKSKGRVRNAE